MVQIIKAKDIKERPLRLLIYGEAGAGKTTLIGTAPKPILVIDFEAGADIIFAGQDGVDILPIYERKDLKEALLWLRTQKQYKTIAFDGFSIYAQQVLREILDSRNKETATFYEWNLLISHLKEVVLGLIKPTSCTIFTSLLRKTKDAQGNLVSMHPDLPHTVREYIKAVVDLVGIIYVNKTGERYVGFTSSKGVAEVKDRSGKLTDKEEPNITKILMKVYSYERKEGN